ncbi:MAG: ParB/RepB/Spo0J family partition protein [Cytophagales bacterium]|nr:ParB/RepB/Spo0J family partition protein [Armatimonadota bacterium]
MQIRLIELTRIVEDPDQPRRAIDDAAIASLADSIRQHGLLNPITITPLEGVDGFRIITGERRWRASNLAGLFDIPCIVRETPPTDLVDKTTEQLIENLQREELAPLDKATAIKSLKVKLEATNKEVGLRLGLSERTVGYLLDLLDLPESIGEQIISSPNRPADGNLTEKHGRFLRQLNEDPDLQNKLVEKIKDEKLSADDAGRVAKALRAFPDKQDEILGLAMEDLGRVTAGGGRGSGAGGGGGIGLGSTNREGRFDFKGTEIDISGTDGPPAFSMGRAFIGILERVVPTLDEVKVASVPAGDLPALEEALLRVQATVETKLREVRAAARR